MLLEQILFSLYSAGLVLDYSIRQPHGADGVFMTFISDDLLRNFISSLKVIGSTTLLRITYAKLTNPFLKSMTYIPSVRLPCILHNYSVIVNV